jgi:beta-xylosidase
MRRAALLLALAAVLAGCGGSDDRAAEPGTTQPTTEAAPAGDTFQNPVYEDNFPDPHVILVDGTYYAYATNDNDGNVQTLRSKDLVEWTEGPDALPELGPWSYPGKTWAPEVLALENGTFVLYYTANAADFGRQCIGVAVARKPEGPFVDKAKKPFVCQDDEGGSIDAAAFRDDDGSLYLLWKNDGNCCGMDTWIYSQRLSADGRKLVGKPARLVKQDAVWEGNLVEAPTLWKEEGRYYLFFSANAFDSDAYAVGYATCDAPLGPCEDAPENPILKSACDASGPGHQTIVRDDDDETWFVYHAWPADGSTDRRVMWIDPLVWEDGKPVVEGPTCKPQPVP